jgi:hypothetical protein
VYRRACTCYTKNRKTRRENEGAIVVVSAIGREVVEDPNERKKTLGIFPYIPCMRCTVYCIIIYTVQFMSAQHFLFEEVADLVTVVYTHTY